MVQNLRFNICILDKNWLAFDEKEISLKQSKHINLSYVRSSGQFGVINLSKSVVVGITISFDGVVDLEKKNRKVVVHLFSEKIKY